MRDPIQHDSSLCDMQLDSKEGAILASQLTV